MGTAAPTKMKTPSTPSTEDGAEYDLVLVGSGISGIAALDAYRTLNPSAKILVLESHPTQLGGHEYTVEVDASDNNGGDATRVGVDLGFMVYNNRTYPNMIRLFDKYGVETMDSDMSLSTYYGDYDENNKNSTWSFGSGLPWLLANIWRPRLYGFLSSHKRFRTLACEVLGRSQLGDPSKSGKSDSAANNKPSETLASFTETLNDENFVKHWLLPFVKAVWSFDKNQDCLRYPILPLLRFMENHGFLSDPLTGLVPWRTVKHRSRDIVSRVILEGDKKSAGASVTSFEVDAKVTGLTEDPDESTTALVKVEYTKGGEATRSALARHVVLTGSAQSQAKILEHSSDNFSSRCELLQRLGVTRTLGVLHSDPKYMPSVKTDWAAWNVQRTYTTYWLNKIQPNIGQEKNFFFTLLLDGFDLGSLKEPLEELHAMTEDSEITALLQPLFGRSIQYLWRTTHPRYSFDAKSDYYSTVGDVFREAQGSGVQHAGAWTRHGFHEDGLVSGLLAVRKLEFSETTNPLTLPVYYPMSVNPGMPQKVEVPLVHVVLPDSKSAFASTWRGLTFDSRSPPGNVLQCDHALGSLESVEDAEETKLLQDASIRESFLKHTGVFPSGRIQCWCMGRPNAANLIPAFNPFSWFVAYDELDSGKPIAYLAEVHNTPWGEHVLYGWKEEDLVVKEDVKSITIPKTMHVSPMNVPPESEDGGTIVSEKSSSSSHYLFELGKNENHVSITLFERGKHAFRAEFKGHLATSCTAETGTLPHAFGGPLAFLEVYKRAASKICSGARQFYDYAWPEAFMPNKSSGFVKEYSTDNHYVFYTGMVYWAISSMVEIVNSTPTTSTWACFGTLGLLHYIYSKQAHLSGETDLLSMFIDWVVLLVWRIGISLASASDLEYTTIIPNALTIFLMHTIVYPVLPVARASRVAVQTFEPALWRIAPKMWGMIQLSFGIGSNLSFEAASDSAVGATFLDWFLLWLALKVLGTLLLQLFWYPTRMHPELRGHRPASHNLAEKSGLLVLCMLNALMCTNYAFMRYYNTMIYDGATEPSPVFETGESTIGIDLQTRFQCCAFTTYCLADLLIGVVYMMVKDTSMTSKGLTTNENCTTNANSPAATLAISASRLYTYTGFSPAFFAHHVACITIGGLGVAYNFWRHEFVWLVGLEGSGPFMYLWMFVREAQKGTFFGTPTMRLMSYLLFVVSFFLFRLVGGSIGLYYLLRYRLPFTTKAEAERVLSMSDPLLGISFWVTLTAFVPLLFLQLVWFQKMIFGILPREAMPFVEKLLNTALGSEQFEVRCEYKSSRSGAKRNSITNSNDKKTASDPSVLHALRPAPGQPLKPRFVLVMHKPYKVIKSLLTRGDVGFGESYVRGDWNVETSSDSNDLNTSYDHAMFVALRHLCKVSYQGSSSSSSSGSESSGILGTLFGLLTGIFGLVFKWLTDHVRVGDAQDGKIVSSTTEVHLLPDMTSTEARQKSIAEHYDGDQSLFDAFQGTTRVYTAALFEESEIVNDIIEAQEDGLGAGGHEEAIAVLHKDEQTSISTSGTTATKSTAPTKKLTKSDKNSDDQSTDQSTEASECWSSEASDTSLVEVSSTLSLQKLSSLVHSQHASQSCSLDEAQLRKIRRILGDLGKLQHGETVLDLGCGYGELIKVACDKKEFGASHGTGITNSVEMAQEFENRVSSGNDRSGFGKMEAVVGDFLELPPTLQRQNIDLITSVESIEAIHYRDYRRLARQCYNALRSDGKGRAVFQIIHAYGSRNETIRRKEFMPGTTFVQTYIFPGQQLPYLEYVYDCFRAEGMIPAYTEQSGMHYARTLRIWRQKLWFHQYHDPETGERTGKGRWSETEYRKFAYYLAWCEAGFREGILDVARVVFVKG